MPRHSKPGTIDGIKPGETLDAYEKRVGDDAPEWSDADWDNARPGSDFPNLREAFANARARGHRGPQKTPVKDRVGLRLDHAIVEYFRSTGPGWQGRINDVLADHIKKHS